jgi:uncharacterized protein with PIN domain
MTEAEEMKRILQFNTSRKAENIVCINCGKRKMYEIIAMYNVKTGNYTYKNAEKLLGYECKGCGKVYGIGAILL